MITVIVCRARDFVFARSQANVDAKRLGNYFQIICVSIIYRCSLSRFGDVEMKGMSIELENSRANFMLYVIRPYGGDDVLARHRCWWFYHYYYYFILFCLQWEIFNSRTYFILIYVILDMSIWSHSQDWVCLIKGISFVDLGDTHFYEKYELWLHAQMVCHTRTQTYMMVIYIEFKLDDSDRETS